MPQSRSTHGLAALLWCSSSFAACNGRDTTGTHVATPAQPTAPAPPAAPATSRALPPGQPLEAHAPKRADNVPEPNLKPTRSAVASTEHADSTPKPTKAELTPVAAPFAPAADVTQPPAASAAPPAPKRTPLPQTVHVRFVVSEPMQQLLDADGRMDGWLNQLLAVIDRCYVTTLAGDANAAGIVTAELTMHENARPSVDLHEPPGALANVVECASGSNLMNKRPPLFTGPEGQRHLVSVHFTP